MRGFPAGTPRRRASLLLDVPVHLSYDRRGRGEMLQIYFLSVAANTLAGIILASDWITRKFTGVRAVTDGLSTRRGKLTAGLLSLFVGFVTLLFPSRPPIVLGDLAPSVAGLAMGVALLFEVLRQESLFPAERGDMSERQSRAPVAYRTTLGMLGLAAALVHFFLPERFIV
jgi:hypothetical protein